MANVDRVSGFTLLSPKEGKYVQKCKKNSSYGTAMAIGNVVRASGQSDSDGLVEVQNVVSASNTDALGVVIGFDGPTNYNNLNQVYSPASQASFPLVYTDPFARYVVQEDSVGGALAATDVGQLIDITDAGPNTTTGTSGQEIDSSSVGASGTFRILELYRFPGNVIGTNAKWVVTFAEHQDITDAVAT